MNILNLGVMDCSGAGYALMDAINKHTSHEARFVVGRHTRYRYPTDIIRPGLDKLWRLVDWADVYNFQVRGDEMLPDGAPRKPTVKTYHGSGYRNHWRELNAKAKACGWVQTCLTVDLSQFGATWIGRAMPDLSHMYDPGPGFHVAHAGASGRKNWKRNRKGTSIVEAVAAEFEDVTFDIFREVTNDECLKRKAKAHLYIDQVGPYAIAGHGTNALEAWALGMPVVVWTSNEILDLMRERFGQLPFCACYDADSLRQCIVQFRDSPELRAHWTAIGRQYVQRWHSPAFVAERYVELFERAIDDFA